MIAHLKGNVEKVLDSEIIVDVSGVGYRVVCSQRVIDYVRNNRNDVVIYTDLQIRDTAWTLYGFTSDKERILFNLLISVQGVGGKIALAILSALTDTEIYNAFINDDKLSLCKADGVGERLATRIVTELKSKMIKMSDLQKLDIPSSGNAPVINDVRSALINLGYSVSDVTYVLSDLALQNLNDFNELLKSALKKLYEYKK